MGTVSIVTELPVWAVYAVSLGTPIAAFLGVLIGTVVTRKGDTELEARSKREEVMRTLRWAAEKAVSEDAGEARLGLLQLEALGDSALLDEDGQVFLEAALTAVVKPRVEEYLELEGSVEIVELVDADAAGVLEDAPAPDQPEQGEPEAEGNS